MPPIPPRKRKGPHNPVDDRLLLELWKVLRIENPRLSKRKFANIAHRNYYQKGAPNELTSIDSESIVRHLNRLLRK